VWSTLEAIGIRRNRFCFNAMLGAAARFKRLDVIEQLAREMHLEGIEPDIVTFNSVLQVHLRVRRLLRFGLRHFSITIDLLYSESAIPSIQRCTVVTYGTYLGLPQRKQVRKSFPLVDSDAGAGCDARRAVVHDVHHGVCAGAKAGPCSICTGGAVC
jgi:pentatricopeptide repeat protein